MEIIIIYVKRRGKIAGPLKDCHFSDQGESKSGDDYGQ